MNSLCFHAYSIFINIRGDIIGGRRKTTQNTVKFHWKNTRTFEDPWFLILTVFVQESSPKIKITKQTKHYLSLAGSPLHLRLDCPCSITFDPRYLYLLRHTINRHSSAKSTCPLAKMFVMNVNACSYKVRQMWLDISTIYWTLDVKMVDIAKIFLKSLFSMCIDVDVVDTKVCCRQGWTFKTDNWILTNPASYHPNIGINLNRSELHHSIVIRLASLYGGWNKYSVVVCQKIRWMQFCNKATRQY